MAMNPKNLFKFMQFRDRFSKNHPKAVSYIQNVLMSGIPEGTIIEMTVTKPGQQPATSNIRVTADDLEMLNEITRSQE